MMEVLDWIDSMEVRFVGGASAIAMEVQVRLDGCVIDWMSATEV